MTPSPLSRALQHILQSEPNTLRAAVAAEALEHDDPASFLLDVVQWGCKVGTVRSLIYIADTEAFALNHYQVILELREEVEESTGTSLRLGYQLLNDLAWFAFEETAYRLAGELGLDT